MAGCHPPSTDLGSGPSTTGLEFSNRDPRFPVLLPAMRRSKVGPICANHCSRVHDALGGGSVASRRRCEPHRPACQAKSLYVLPDPPPPIRVECLQLLEGTLQLVCHDFIVAFGCVSRPREAGLRPRCHMSAQQFAIMCSWNNHCHPLRPTTFGRTKSSACSGSRRCSASPRI